MVYHSLLQALLPACCRLCGCALTGRIDLCAACAAELPWLDDACPRCAMPLATSHAASCGHCQRQPPCFDACIAAFSYEYPVRELIGRFKFHGDLAAGRALALLLARRLGERECNATPETVLVPVPLHRSRLAERGFNQSERIARVLSRELGLPLRQGLVRRTERTEDQKTLDAAARRRNLARAFRARPCTGLRIVLVDDVLTTGATADALATVLREAGATSVHVWCLARAL